MALTKNFHILAIGDCNTSGVEKYNVPLVFSEKLKDTGMQCSLENLGGAMLTSREGLAKIREHRSNADILLLNFGLVDAWITSIPDIYISYHPDNRLKKRARKALKSIKKRLRHPLARRLVPSGPVVDMAEFKANIEAIINTAVQTNPNVQIILWGSAPNEEIERSNNLIKYDKVLAELATRYGVFVDTASILADQHRESIFLDSSHLSLKGCEIVADAMIDSIKHRL